MPRTPSKSATSGKSTQPQISAKLLEELIPGPVTKEEFEDIFQNFKKAFIERALNAEMSHHLGYGAGQAKPEGATNHRNGSSTKTVITDNAGPVEIEVPRDREGTFEPVIVAKRARRLSDLDAVVLSLSAKGLTHGEISAHFADVYGASVSQDTVSRITDRSSRR